MKYRTLAESIISDKSVNSSVKIATQEAVQESAQKFLNAHSLNGSAGGNLKQQELLRSESDKFDYKLIRLDNGLRVLLISDPSYKDLASATSASSSQDNINSAGTSDVEMSDHEGGHSDAESVASSVSSSSASSKKGNDKEAAIAIGVHAGGFQDPDDFPGMAHMLEHMISMGSEAYPLENALDDFLSSRGGYQNAHTEVEYTMYEIKVHRNHFKKAIDIIGKAFVAPLLRATSIDREIKPVDTEFVQACNYDDVRAQLVLNENANQKHPISKFMWGNRKSLITDPTAKGLDIRQNLLEFFNKYYYPENIVVVVQSQEPLANLEEWTMVFADVKARTPATTPTAEAALSSSIAPFDNAKFNRFYIMEAISSGTQLQVNWVLPQVLDKYLTSSFDYLCALLGHEGKGSLIAELRKRDLAIDLVTDSEYFCHRNNSLLSIFGLEIHLTEGGALRLEEVVQLIFEYITVIRSVGAQEFFYRENQTIAHKSFNNKSERSPIAYVVDLATNMMHYPVEHTLSGHSLYYHYDKAAIDDLLAHFLPHNVNLIHIGGKFKPELPTLSEKWMGTKYQEMAIPAAWIEKANQCHPKSDYFYYPKPNAFIATKFDLLRDTLPPSAPERLVGEYPTTVLKATERLTVWHKPDFKFNLPKGSMVLHLLNPCIDGSLQDLALADVFFEYVMYLLKEDTYDALAAELNWNLSQTYNGIQIRASGFNHKLADLVILILNRLKTIEFEPTILESMKTEVTKHYNNNYQDQDTFNQHLRLFLLVDRFYTYLDRWPLIAAIDKAQMEAYKAKVLSNLSIELLVQGNISIEETTKLGSRIDELLKLSSTSSVEPVPYAKQKTLVRQLPVGVNRIRALTLSEKNSMSQVVCYYQLKPYDIESTICLSLFISMIEELCFDTLRYCLFSVNRIRALTLSEKNSMSQVVCYYQLKPYDIESTICLSLFISMIEELCFDTLRTKEGLGYRVCCGENDTFGILGFNVTVASQAAKFQCSFMEERISAFVDTRCREFIDTLSQAKFEEFVSSALKRRQAPDVSLGEEVGRNMGEICSFDYCFDRLKREIAQLKQITLEGFKKWTVKHIFVPANERRQLTVQVVGNGEVSLAECTTVDGSPVNESMIPRESSQGRCKPLLLLHAKEEKKGFIENAEAFRKQLPMFPLQPSAKDLK